MLDTVHIVSCAPTWREQEHLSYNLFLFIVGFFIPLLMIIVTSLGVLYILRKVMQTNQANLTFSILQNMTAMSSEFVKKGAEKREKQVLIMVGKD